MKKFISALIFTFMVSLTIQISAEPCTSEHNCNGCTINFTQDTYNWSYTMQCGGGAMQFYSEPGEFVGTFCNGQEPCSLCGGEEPCSL